MVQILPLYTSEVRQQKVQSNTITIEISISCLFAKQQQKFRKNATKKLWAGGVDQS